MQYTKLVPGVSATSRRTSRWRMSGPYPRTAAPRTSKPCSSSWFHSIRPTHSLSRLESCGAPAIASAPGSTSVQQPRSTAAELIRGQTADSGYDRNLTDRSAASGSVQYGRGPEFQLHAFRVPLSHRRRIRRGSVEPHLARRAAPRMGRSGRRPLPRTNGHICQATRRTRQAICGDDQSVPVPDCLPSTHASDRTSVEYPHFAVKRVRLASRSSVQPRSHEKTGCLANLLVTQQVIWQRTRREVPTAPQKMRSRYDQGTRTRCRRRGRRSSAGVVSSSRRWACRRSLQTASASIDSSVGK